MLPIMLSKQLIILERKRLIVHQCKYRDESDGGLEYSRICSMTTQAVVEW